jgi:hypothetical protein
MIITIITVPKMAGKMPPSVLDSRGSPLTNSHSRPAYTCARPQVVSRLGRKARNTSSVRSSFCWPSAAATVK